MDPQATFGYQAAAAPTGDGAVPAALAAPRPGTDRLPPFVEERLQRLLGLREVRLQRPRAEAEYLRLMDAMRRAESRTEWQRLSEQAFPLQQQLLELDRTADLIDEALRELRQFLLT